MTPTSPVTGVFALRWSQTETDGCIGLGPDWLRVGARWTWSGDFLRLDGAQSVLILRDTLAQDRLHARARRVAERLSGDVSAQPIVDDNHDAPDSGFALTDGASIYSARFVRHGSDWLAVFAGRLPPKDTPCWVTASNLAGLGRPARPAQDVICFSDDALIATPQGPRPIALLNVGDTVTTRDNGPQPVRWIGRTTISGLALRQYPHLRPIRLRRDALGEARPDDDLRVSPAHRILVCGARAQALFGCDEVLVRASDLVDYTTIAPDIALHGVTYIHLLFDAHQIIYANGVPTESFHPALAPSQTLRQHRQAIARLSPDWVAAPHSYGATVRRCLNRGEAALLAA